MKNYTLCILDNDTHYVKAFMKVVALEHAGFSVGTRSACGDGCAGETDVCLSFEAGRGSCEKAFVPGCGKYAGVAAILSETKKFLFDREMFSSDETAPLAGKERRADATAPDMAALICVYSYAGGSGTSCAAIGIGRELARYRGEQVLYLSLEDAEDAGLFPSGLRAMRAEEALYRYLRLLNSGTGQDGFDRLFRAAAARDEYGLYRLSPDGGAGSLASLETNDLYMFLAYIAGSLGLTRIVLDFGTRLHFLKLFGSSLERNEALYIEVRQEAAAVNTRSRRVLYADERVMGAVFPVCEEDVRSRSGYTDVGISNAFGLAVKEICDRIAEDAL